MLASKTFTNSNLVDGLLSWNHGLNTVNVIPAWKDNEGVYRTIGDLFKVVDKDNVILSCNSAIEGTHTLYLTYETAIRIVTSDANLLLSFSEQQLIRPMSTYNSTNTQAVNRYKQLAYEVECYEIDKLLGSAFYQDISKNPANYTDLLNGCLFVDRSDNTIEHRGLKYVIAYLNYAKYIGDSYVNDTFTGLVQKTRPDSERISTGDIKRLQQEYREIAFNAFDLIREYLYLDPETYPLWKNERKKDMKTNKKFYGVNFRTICIFLIGLLSYNINAQSLSIARFPYKNIVQNFQGDTIWTKINGDTASIHTNLNFFNFDKPILINGDTIQGGSGTWPTDSANYAAKSLLNDSINALHNRTSVSQHIKPQDTTRWGTNSSHMVYPEAGIPISTGSAWGTSITNNSSNWNTAYDLSHSHANLSLLSDIKASDTTRWASGGVTPTDNIFDWDATNNWYAPYSAKQASMSIYTGSETPTLTTRLNIDGYLYATSFRGNSATSWGIYGLSTSSYGVYAGSVSSYGVYAYSTSGHAIRGSSTTGNALYASQEGILTSSISNDVLSINKLNTSSSYNATGSLLSLNDNPSITNSIVSGSLISGFVGSTERLRLDPRVKGHADSTAYVLDTHRQALSTDTLLSIKNLGSNKFQVLYDGSVYSKGSIFKQGSDTLATQAYVRSHGGSGGGGTVTSVSVTTANGISGTVANATTTPIITILPDTVNKYKTHAQAVSDTNKLHNQISAIKSQVGILKSNGSIISAAVPGVDYISGISGSNNQVAYFNSSGSLTSNSGFTFDGTTIGFGGSGFQSGTVAGIANNAFIRSGASNGVFVTQPLTNNTCSRFYVIPYGSPSGSTGKFDIFNTDYISDNANYNGTTWFTENTNNTVQFGPNRLGNVTRLKMVVGGDYVGSSLTSISPRIDFNTNNSLSLNYTGSGIGLGTLNPSWHLSFDTLSYTKKIWTENKGRGSNGVNLEISAGSTTNYGSATFTALSQANGARYGMCVSDSGHFFAVVSNGSLYKMANESFGTLVDLGITTRDYRGLWFKSNQKLVLAVNSGSIYEYDLATYTITDLSETSRAWRGGCEDIYGNDWVAVNGGGIYKRTGGTGVFTIFDSNARAYMDLTSDDKGNVWACVNAGDIYVLRVGDTQFRETNQTARAWLSIEWSKNGNIYAAVQLGDLYVLNNAGLGQFTALGQTSRSWYSICTSPVTYNIYASVINADVYRRLNVAGASDKNGGTLSLYAGRGKGSGTSNISFNTSTTLNSGSELQSYSEKMRINGDGDIEIFTPGKGIILKSPDGTRYKLTIANGGTVSITAL
jgi:hypothetical protein